MLSTTRSSITPAPTMPVTRIASTLRRSIPARTPMEPATHPTYSSTTSSAAPHPIRLSTVPGLRCLTKQTSPPSNTTSSTTPAALSSATTASTSPANTTTSPPTHNSLTPPITTTPSRARLRPLTPARTASSISSRTPITSSGPGTSPATPASPKSPATAATSTSAPTNIPPPATTAASPKPSPVPSTPPRKGRA